MKLDNIFMATPFDKTSTPIIEDGQCGGKRMKKNMEDEEFSIPNGSTTPNAHDKYGTYYIRRDRKGNVVAGWEDRKSVV